MNFRDYIKAVRASGQSAFTADKAIADLNISRNALNCGIYKLKKKREIISPAKHLYVIVPPEHQALGCLPAEELVPILMKHWDMAYYICGLSAAYYHGASHQKPQVFQVMANKPLKDLTCGKIKLVFFYKKNWVPWQIEQRVVKTGYLQVASPELTALDLLTYRNLAGGLNHTATVFTELIEVMNPASLLKTIETVSKHAWWQRLGYILEHIDVLDPKRLEKILSTLRHYAETQSLSWVPLAPELPIKGRKRDTFWMIIENTTLEADE